MKLKISTLESRDFLIQYNDILGEFGHEIPRLKKISNLKYFTDAQTFKEEMFSLLGLEKTETITPYMLTTDDRKAEYIGGMLNFSKSPEVFEDANNELIRKQLENDKYAYVTCLQVRDALRINSYGIQIFSQSVENILKEFHKFRGVVSKEKLFPYYKYFGLEIINDNNNKDGLFVLTCDEQSFKKRH